MNGNEIAGRGGILVAVVPGQPRRGAGAGRAPGRRPRHPLVCANVDPDRYVVSSYVDGTVVALPVRPRPPGDGGEALRPRAGGAHPEGARRPRHPVLAATAGGRPCVVAGPAGGRHGCALYRHRDAGGRAPRQRARVLQRLRRGAPGAPAAPARDRRAAEPAAGQPSGSRGKIRRSSAGRIVPERPCTSGRARSCSSSSAARWVRPRGTCSPSPCRRRRRAVDHVPDQRDRRLRARLAAAGARAPRTG